MSYFVYEGHKIYYEEHGAGKPLLLLHGNTTSSKMFMNVVLKFTDTYHVFLLDFLGCGQSQRVDLWPIDLWFEWAKQVMAFCEYKQLDAVDVIGCSGGALVAINMALENPKQIHAVVADSFEGIQANSYITEQIQIGRQYAKQNQEFCTMMEYMHGQDWETILDADTQAIVHHANQIGIFFHQPLSSLQVKMLLTGSKEDEMFEKEHYNKLFHDIKTQTNLVKSHIFQHGNHPAMISNIDEFVSLCRGFFDE